MRDAKFIMAVKQKQVGGWFVGGRKAITDHPAAMGSLVLSPSLLKLLDLSKPHLFVL